MVYYIYHAVYVEVPSGNPGVATVISPFDICADNFVTYMEKYHPNMFKGKAVLNVINSSIEV